MGGKNASADIFVSDKTRGAIMSEMGRYSVSMKVAITTDMK